jgi:hypothetical protein
VKYESIASVSHNHCSQLCVHVGARVAISIGTQFLLISAARENSRSLGFALSEGTEGVPCSIVCACTFEIL